MLVLNIHAKYAALGNVPKKNKKTKKESHKSNKTRWGFLNPLKSALAMSKLNKRLPGFVDTYAGISSFTKSGLLNTVWLFSHMQTVFRLWKI